MFSMELDGYCSHGQTYFQFYPGFEINSLWIYIWKKRSMDVVKKHKFESRDREVGLFLNQKN